MIEQTKTEILQNGVTGTANGNAVEVSGYDTVLFQLNNVGTSTQTFQASSDGSNWYGLITTNVSNNQSGTTGASEGLYRASSTGIRFVRSVVSDYTAGTITTLLTASTGEGAASGGGAAVTSGGTFTQDQTQGQAMMAVYQGTATTVADGEMDVVRMSDRRAIKTDSDTLAGGEDLTNDVQGFQFKPVVSVDYSPSDYTSFGVATGAAVKTTPGNVLSAYVTSGTTAVRYFQLFNGTAAPSNGGTPVASYPMGSVAAGALSTLDLGTDHFAPSKYFSAGIAWAMSSTQGTLGTASVTASDVSVCIKYV